MCVVRDGKCLFFLLTILRDVNLGTHLLIPLLISQSDSVDLVSNSGWHNSKNENWDAFCRPVECGFGGSFLPRA